MVRPVRCRAVAGAVSGRVAHAVAYVDTFAELIDKPIWAAEVNAGDGSHPTTAGYERLTEIIFKPWWGLADALSGSSHGPAVGSTSEMLQQRRAPRSGQSVSAAGTHHDGARPRAL